MNTTKKRVLVKRNKRRKPRPIKRVLRPSKTLPTTVSLPECTLKYLKALTDPFGSVHGACIPTYPSKPSMKIRTFIQTDGFIGLAGVGFAMLSPVYEDGTNALYYTTAAAPGNIFATSGVGIATSTFSNSPFTPTDISTGRIQGRAVACGLRIVYTGTELNKSGMTTCIVEPDHGSLNNKSIPNCLAYGDNVTKSDPVTRKWCTAVAVPLSADDLEYDHIPYVKGPSGLVPFMGIFISGVPGSSFRIEAYLHFEAIGVAAVSPTDNQLDPSGTAAVIAATSKAIAIPSAKTSQSWFQTALKFTKQYLVPTVKTLAPIFV
jgi:hypothetical protein